DLASPKPSTGRKTGPAPGAAPPSVKRAEQAFKQPRPVAAPEQRLKQALRMRHHAQNAAARITDAGNVALRAVGIGPGGDIAAGIDVAEDDAAFAIKFRQCV